MRQLVVGSDLPYNIIVGGSIVQRLNMRGVSTILLILVSGRGRVEAFVSPQIPTIRTTTHTYYLQETANTQPIDKEEEEVTEIEGHHHKKKKKYVVGSSEKSGEQRKVCVRVALTI